MKGHIFADSSAALGIAKRRGCGEMRHQSSRLDDEECQPPNLGQMAALLQQHFKKGWAEN